MNWKVFMDESTWKWVGNCSEGKSNIMKVEDVQIADFTRKLETLWKELGAEEFAQVCMELIDKIIKGNKSPENFGKIMKATSVRIRELELMTDWFIS